MPRWGGRENYLGESRTSASGSLYLSRGGSFLLSAIAEGTQTPPGLSKRTDGPSTTERSGPQGAEWTVPGFPGAFTLRVARRRSTAAPAGRRPRRAWYAGIPFLPAHRSHGSIDTDAVRSIRGLLLSERCLSDGIPPYLPKGGLNKNQAVGADADLRLRRTAVAGGPGDRPVVQPRSSTARWIAPRTTAPDANYRALRH